ncbi:Uncharacterised protein [Neisseria animaloris]|uniref:hypothetical protein n=1 Tax=Neisseria animaloris TaxID=326522 RepID=UPI000F70D263|nr:hypothetical protein [Neisseria animaloris]VEH87813.1 Uncharacterised protein [Neisseria animaloris]
MINYYENGDARDLTAPMDTLTTKDRLALVTVKFSLLVAEFFKPRHHTLFVWRRGFLRLSLPHFTI